MARWSPTVLPYAPDPFEAGDRIARGIYGGVQLDQGQQRLNDMKARTAIAEREMADREAWSTLQRGGYEAGLHDKYGYENTPRAENLPAREGAAPEVSGLPSPDQAPGTKVRLQSEWGGPPKPMGAQGAPPGPQFSAGDVRNQPGVMERYTLATGASIAPMGQRPTDIYATQERERVGSATYDYLAPILGLGPEAEQYMRDVGPDLPGLKPYQRAGYESNAEFAGDAYALNRYDPAVLAALLRENSTGRLSAGEQLKIDDATFSNAVYDMLTNARSAGTEMTVQQAFAEVQRRTGYRGTVTADQIAQGYGRIRTGDFEGYPIPVQGNTAVDAETAASITEAMDRLDSPTSNASTLWEILAMHPDPDWQNLFWQTLANRQAISMSQRVGGAYTIGNR